MPLAPPAVSVVVFAARPDDRYRAGRTLRALTRRGLDPIDATAIDPRQTSSRLDPDRPVWLIHAGALPVETTLAFPPPSATQMPLCALGAARPSDEGGHTERSKQWRAIVAATGGDLATHPGEALPLSSLYLEAAAARELTLRLSRGQALHEAAAAILRREDLRRVRWPGLDVHHDDRLRVVLAITSLQQGGAERVVLDLFHELSALDICPRIITLGRPTRAAFDAPPGTVDVSTLGPDRRARVDALALAALAHGADLIHAHLLTGADIAQLSTHGVPIAITVHNTRAGWPEGLERLDAAHASLLIACSLAAEADLRTASLPVPCRTIWNGIDTTRFHASPKRTAKGAALRRAHKIRPGDLVLCAVANPRPQKRLHLLPDVLLGARAELARRRVNREARLLIVGDASPESDAARRSAGELQHAIEARGVAREVRFTGSMDDVSPALAAADVLVSVSAHEGLSLAHLEALAAGLPVVATDAGGTAEIAPHTSAITVLPLDVEPARLGAMAVERALAPPAGGAEAIEASFSRSRMARRHHFLYRRVIEAAGGRARGRGILLITNNFSTGGAQSSARRLLMGLAEAGERVRAAVLEEQPAYPTPGRRALEAAGIPVFALPPAGSIDAEEAVTLLLEHLDEERPGAVLLWNALAEYKLLLADALFDVPVFDVSPGEMFFASLDRAMQRPRAGLPYRDGRAYGARLAGVIVKYEAEAERARATLGAPVHVVPNGVDLVAVPARRSRGDRLRIGTAARLSPQKKLEQLLEALRLARADLPPHVLSIAGGPERGGAAYAEELRRLAAGLEVEWVGEVEDTGAWLGDLDLFAMISEPAGCPNASLEAMAAGLAVIATDVGGASEQVVDGVTGRLVPRGDVGAFAAALVELGRDETRRRSFGAAGRARVEERFAARRMIEDYRRICLGDRV